MNESEAATPSHAGSVIAGAIAVLVAVYFFLPVVYAAPATALNEAGYLPDAFGEALFKPIAGLMSRIPAYETLVDRETEFCQKLGLLKGR